MKVGRKSLVFFIIALLAGVNALHAIASHDIFLNQTCSHQIDIQSATLVAKMKLYESGKSNDFFIRSAFEIYRDNEKTILFYIFDLQPQGYIVVSADARLPPIIAYSFTSNFQANASECNILLQMLKADIQLRLENIPNVSKETIEKRNVLWHKFLKDEPRNIANNNFQQWPPEGTTTTGGWLETNWHQEPPYNNFCPIDSGTEERSVAGCPAVAMAQILNYHKNSNNITFDDDDDYYHNYGANRYWIDDDHEVYDFPSFPELNSYLTTLAYHYENQIPPTDDDKAALVFACGVAAQQVYTSEVSGTFGVDQAYRAYLRFGIDDIELLDENDGGLYGRLRMNMVDSLPAHLAVVVPDWSAGHNVVVDGYNTDDYYHLNFGWGGVWNGWYLLPDEMPFKLTVIEGVIIDILNTHAGSDIFCDGILHWSDVTPESTLTGNFTVKNIGDSGSSLNWEIDEWPEWGTWTFTPSNGGNLAPEDDGATINVSVVVPDKKNRDFTGYVKVINKKDDNDFFILPVSLVTPVNKNVPVLQFLESLIQQFPILQRIFLLFRLE